MSDTRTYSDVVFGMFRLLGNRFSPRLVDIGGSRLWRIDKHVGYGEFNAISKLNIPLTDQNYKTLG